MSGARDQILHDVRKALGRGPLSAGARAELETRLRAPHANLIPARAQGSHDSLITLFVDMAKEAAATVARAEAGGVPATVVEYLADHNLPMDVVMAPDPTLDDYPWAEQPHLGIDHRRARDGDAVGITGAFAGIAETGTLMLLSGAGRPTTLNLLPDTHIVVLRADRIVGPYEAAWARLREATRGRDESGFAMPRTVNLITGPSRTADIEQRIHIGAHGPRRLHIVLVDASA